MAFHIIIGATSGGFGDRILTKVTYPSTHPGVYELFEAVVMFELLNYTYSSISFIDFSLSKAANHMC